MATRTKKTVKKVSSPKEETLQQMPEKSLTIPLPSFDFKTLSNITTTHVLMGLLIIASFFLGVLFTKVQYLQNNGSSALAANTGTQPTTAVQPTLGKQNVSVGSYAPLGDPNAKVKIVVFEDDRCPFCKQLMIQTEPQIKKDYVDTGKAVIYFRNYAFLGASSTLAANANSCANEQNKFWDWITYMYNNQPAETDTSMYTNDNLTNIAGQLGMDTTQFSSCMTSNKYANLESQDLSDGQKAGVTGTPTIFVNGNPIVGAVPYSQIKAAIDKEL